MAKVCFCLNADIKGKDGICPCYQCEERAVGCHSSCEKFGTWSENHKKNKREIQKKVYIERQADYRRKDYLQKRRAERKRGNYE